MNNHRIDVHVSIRRQDTASQEPELRRWAESHDGRTRCYHDADTGTSMDRPGFRPSRRDMETGLIDTLIVWRLDRLGRTAKGWISLFDDLIGWKVNLISLKDGLGLATPSGRLMANILAGVAASETEVRAERILAGQTAARPHGVRWGGSARGRRIKVTAEQVASIRRLRAEGQEIAAIARGTGLSRPTVDRILGEGCKASNGWSDPNRSGKMVSREGPE
jgi:DNA invertase Pin-like site-specific DNA recombinase